MCEIDEVGKWAVVQRSLACKFEPFHLGKSKAVITWLQMQFLNWCRSRLMSENVGCVCVCNIPLYFFVFAVYLLVSYMCAKIRVWSCLVTDNFGLFTEIAVCKFLCGWRLCGLTPFYFVLCFYTFFCSFVYSGLCPRSCLGSCAIEMSIIVICSIPHKSIYLSTDWQLEGSLFYIARLATSINCLVIF